MVLLPFIAFCILDIVLPIFSVYCGFCKCVSSLILSMCMNWQYGKRIPNKLILICFSVIRIFTLFVTDTTDVHSALQLKLFLVLVTLSVCSDQIASVIDE